MTYTLWVIIDLLPFFANWLKNNTYFSFTHSHLEQKEAYGYNWNFIPQILTKIISTESEWTVVINILRFRPLSSPCIKDSRKQNLKNHYYLWYSTINTPRSNFVPWNSKFLFKWDTLLLGKLMHKDFMERLVLLVLPVHLVFLEYMVQMVLLEQMMQTAVISYKGCYWRN